MNIVNLIGNITKNPEVRYTTGTNPTAVCRMNLAVNDGYGEKQRTSFIPIVVFGKQAENCEKYLSKGSKIGVTGRIQTGSYEKDGVTHYTTDVIANSVEFLNTKTSGASGMTTADAGDLSMPPNGFAAIEDDGFIPF